MLQKTNWGGSDSASAAESVEESAVDSASSVCRLLSLLSSETLLSGGAAQLRQLTANNAAIKICIYF